MTIAIRCRRCGKIDPNYPASRATGNELCSDCEPREAGAENITEEIETSRLPDPPTSGKDISLGFSLDDVVSRLDILIEQNETMITSSKNRDSRFEEMIEKFMPMLEKFAKSLDQPPVNPADFTI